MTDFYSKASLVLVPSGYKAGKLYSVKPENGDGDFTFFRESEGTRENANGDIETMAIDVPRLQYPACPSLLLEPSRTNLFLNSFAPVTQTVTVVNATSYAISCSGSGSIELTGAITGTVTEGNPVISNSTTTSLTLTITGELDWVQVEDGVFPTNPIETLGATETRTVDNITLTGLYTNGITGTNVGTWLVDIGERYTPVNSDALNIESGTGKVVGLAFQPGGQIRGRLTQDGNFIFFPYGNYKKIAVRWDDTTITASYDGTLGTPTTATAFGNVEATNILSVVAKLNVNQIQFYPTPLTDQELIELTT